MSDSTFDTPFVAPFDLSSRDELEAQYLRFFLARNPGANENDPQLQLDARQEASMLAPAYTCIAQTYRNTSLLGKDDQSILAELASRGDGLLQASSSTGYVTVSTAAGGETIPDLLQIKINGKLYQVPAGAGGHHVTGDEVQIEALDTGPAGDQPGGAVGTWQGPPPGLLLSATVVALADGTGRGLIGGADAETIEEARQRLRVENASPAASGNAADYEQRGGKTPAIAVDQIFTYPGIKGTGTTGVCATMRRSRLGLSRVPTVGELAKITAWLPGAFPSDDGLFAAATVSNYVTPVYQLQWSGAPGWLDANPWPTYSGTLVTVSGAVTPTATTFRLLNCPTAPIVGNTIAFYDPVNLVFRPKRILTATNVAGSTYDIVCDTTAGATDTTYTPAATQPTCPYSVSLDLLVTPTLEQFVALGPGEQQASPWDPEQRERRHPAEPLYPYTIGHKFTRPLEQISAIKDIVLAGMFDSATVNAIPYVTPNGSPGVTAYLSQCSYIVALPE